MAVREHESMVDLPSREPLQPRIPFSIGYLATVVMMAVVNAQIFGLLARRFQDILAPGTSAAVLCFVFGILFAGACNLSASGLTRWVRRRELTDRILCFLLLEILGLTLLALIAPHFLQLLAPEA